MPDSVSNPIPEPTAPTTSAEPAAPSVPEAEAPSPEPAVTAAAKTEADTVPDPIPPVADFDDDNDAVPPAVEEESADEFPPPAAVDVPAAPEATATQASWVFDRPNTQGQLNMRSRNQPDVFETDPFFSSDRPSTEVSPPASAAQPLRTPRGRGAARLPARPARPTAEEQLLATITAGEPDVTDATSDPTGGAVSEAPAAAVPSEAAQAEAEAAVDQAMRDLARLKSRLAELELELTSAREQSAREAQLRKTDAARHAMLESEWTRKAADLKAAAMASDEALLKGGSTARLSAPAVTGLIVTGLLLIVSALLVGRSWGLHATLSDETLPPSALARQAPAPSTDTDTPPVPAADAPPLEATPAPVVKPPPAPVVKPPPAATPPAPIPSGAKPPAKPDKPTGPVWPTVTGGGFKATRNAQVMTIKFDYGVFSRGTVLSDSARKDLKQIAQALKPSLSRFRLEVEGHTDATPVSSGQPHTSNRELGLARAKAVTEYLTKTCGLTAGALTSTSVGDANPPYPNATPDGQRRNRTVVLKLTPVPQQ